MLLKPVTPICHHTRAVVVGNFPIFPFSLLLLCEIPRLNWFFLSSSPRLSVTVTLLCILCIKSSSFFQEVNQFRSCLPRGYTDCAGWKSSGKNKLDNNKGSPSCFCLPISHACTHTALYIGHASRASNVSISSASRPPLQTINHSREEGNGSLRYINDIVHSVSYKLHKLSRCCIWHSVSFWSPWSKRGNKTS